MEYEAVEPGPGGEADVEHALHSREYAGARAVRCTIGCVASGWVAGREGKGERLVEGDEEREAVE